MKYLHWLLVVFLVILIFVGPELLKLSGYTSKWFSLLWAGVLFLILLAFLANEFEGCKAIVMLFLALFALLLALIPDPMPIVDEILLGILAFISFSDVMKKALGVDLANQVIERLRGKAKKR